MRRLLESHAGTVRAYAVASSLRCYGTTHQLGGASLRMVLLASMACVLAGWQSLPPMTKIARQSVAPASSRQPVVPAGAPDLSQVYRDALNDNATYQAALARYRAALEAKPQAVGRLLPKLNASASYNEVYQSLDGTVGDNNGFSGNPAINNFLQTNTDTDRHDDFQRQVYGVTLSQPIYHRDAFIGLEQAGVKIKSAQLALRQARNELAMGAAQAYFALLGARNQLTSVRAEKRAIKRQLDQIQSKLNAGLTSNAKLSAAQAQYDLAAADEIDAENQLQISRTQLENITGRSYSDIKTLPPEASLPPLKTNSPKPWIDAALQYNPALLQQRAGVRIAELTTERARAQRWPKLDLVGGYAYSDQNGGLFTNSNGIGGDNTNQNASIGVRLSLPIFNGGLVSSRIRQASATHDAKVALETQKHVSTVSDTRAAYLNIRRDRARVAALEKAVTSTESAAHAAKVGFNVGTSTSADVLDALRDQYQAKRDYASSRYQYLLDLLTLNKLAGRLNQSTLDVINRRLQ